MVNNNVVNRIGLIFVMLGLFSVAMGITFTPNPDPANLVETAEGVTQTFNLTSFIDNATVKWYFNDSQVQTNTTNISLGITSASYTNDTSIAGFWNVSAVVVNDSNASDSGMVTWFWLVNPPLVGTTPEINNPTNSSLNSSSITIDFDVNQSNANTNVSYSICPLTGPGTIKPNNTPGFHRTIVLTDLSPATNYCYKINAQNATDSSYSVSTIEYSFTTANAPPAVSSPSPSSSTFSTIGKESVNFTVSFTQVVNVTWYRNGTIIKGTENLVTSSYYLESSPSQGTWNISVFGENANGTAMKKWTWTVRPKTYATGNRVWDGSKSMSTQYTWSPRSFYAFYYDVDDDVGNESLEINLDGTTSRTVRVGNLKYRTAPENVSFQFNGWGGYNVIGFMADKYFAGYAQATSNEITGGSPVNLINYQQLHKVLIDDDDTHTIRTSSTYPLRDGYAVSIKDVGKGREAMISILKDNAEVYFDFKEVGETIVYTKRVGAINDVPIIALHISKVFMGTTDNMVQLDGIFQISESYTSVNTANRYGIMDIDAVSDTGIIMTNRNAFTLASGSTIDIMGDMKFIVAKNESVLRFAPMVKRSGEYEVRGSISDNETENEWTPLSFEGFYYDLDGDVGTEKLTLNRSGRSVSADQITYSTSAMPVSFKYSALGKYNVIGFMAEKYFAGYIGENKDEDLVISTKDISTMERGQLHKVLIDDDTQRMIFAGSTLTLNDGYVIKIKDVNMGAGAAEVWLIVLKDGNEVFNDIMEKGDVFTYKKDVGAVKELPLFGLRIETIFRGKEATAAFVKGTFQISESYKTVKQGEIFNKMKIDGVTINSITMKNPYSVTLDPCKGMDKCDRLMGEIRLRPADSNDIRFYPYILVNGSALSANQLAINVPSSLMVRDMISISVTSGTGTPQDNAEVSFDGEVIGTTNATGRLNYTLTKAGMHNFTATKLGYEKAIKTVQISEYVDNRLNFELPEFIDQYIPVTIKVRVSGSGNLISGANITFDGTSIGSTDSIGTMTYTFTSSGKHNLAASKSGYITVQREIDIRMPFTEFKALDINFRPDVVAKGQKVYVWSNITNSGTKEGTLPVALIINETVVENSNVTLAPGKHGEVNFSYKIELPPGNYTMEILGQKTTIPVREEPLNLFLVGGVITGFGAIAIYFLTSKSLISIEAIKAKLNLGAATNQEIINKQAVDNALKNLMTKFRK